ncbi:hypothetical protein ACQPYK_08690 [Streptosporangium sp. CA-135522]|uniref:hypothetical protein n=1 Tax=Streptosporangium sp. CA-135522 TaxID=3240072 RepID=UPI003D8BCA06
MPEPRCPLTELIVAQCGHCREVLDIPFSDLLPAGPERLGPYVTARYSGECADDGEPFEAGDLIRADGHGGWLAECCGGDA